MKMPPVQPAVAKFIFNQVIEDAASLRSVSPKEIERLQKITDPAEILAESDKLTKLNNRVDRARHQIEAAFDTGFISRTQRAALDKLEPSQRIIEGDLIERAMKNGKSAQQIPGMPNPIETEADRPGVKDAARFVADLSKTIGLPIGTKPLPSVGRTPIDQGASIMSHATNSAINDGILKELRQAYPGNNRQLDQIEKIKEPGDKYRALAIMYDRAVREGKIDPNHSAHTGN